MFSDAPVYAGWSQVTASSGADWVAAVGSTIAAFGTIAVLIYTRRMLVKEIEERRIDEEYRRKQEQARIQQQAQLVLVRVLGYLDMVDKRSIRFSIANNSDREIIDVSVAADLGERKSETWRIDSVAPREKEIGTIAVDHLPDDELPRPKGLKTLLNRDARLVARFTDAEGRVWRKKRDSLSQEIELSPEPITIEFSTSGTLTVASASEGRRLPADRITEWAQNCWPRGRSSRQ